MANLFIVEGKFEREHCKEYFPSCNAVACGGHIKENIGYDTETYEPKFEWIPKSTLKEFKDLPSKKEIMARINSLGNNSDIIYICTDDDREGEAIAYHVFSELSASNQRKAIRKALKDWSKDECQNKFNGKIDKVDVPYNSQLNSIKNFDKVGISTNKVASQWFRTTLDRIIGFPLSNYVQRKFIGARSAGRVQSIPLILLILRNEAIKNFVPKTTYGIEFDVGANIVLTKTKLLPRDKAEYVTWDKLSDAKAYKNSNITNEFKVKEIKKSDSKSNPGLPFSNIPLLADANKKLGLATDQVKDILDVLYRKLTLITYPRTDACRIDVPMCEKFRKSLLRIYPRDDINLTEANELFFNKKKSKGQDGHAAITPVDLENTPEKVKNKMESGKSFSTEEMHKLYTLIYNRTKLAFFNPAINENTKTILINKDNEFVNSISKPKYLGWKKYFKEESEEDEKKIDKIYNFELNKIYKAVIFDAEEIYKGHTTIAPKPYTQATILDDMEEKQIGRPSTTASIFKLLKDRKYITGGEGGKKLLNLTSLGEQVGRELMKQFSSIINLEYTIKMEEQIDAIATGNGKYKENLANTESLIQNTISSNGVAIGRKSVEVSGKKCPKCGKDLLIRHYADKKTGKDKTFLGCSGFPKCKHSEFPKENK